MPPRLLVNSRWKHSRKFSGVQRYAAGLERAIRASDINAHFAQPPNRGRASGILWEQRVLPRRCKGYDALLCPANMAPLHLDPNTCLLVTVHCLRFHFHPEGYSPGFVRWYKRMMPRVIERADTIFTVSQAQKIEIETVFPDARDKIELMPPGVDEVFHPNQPRDPHIPDGAYLIALTTPAPPKNLAVLLRSYQESNDLPPLILVGVDDRQADLLCPASIRHRVLAMGQIDEPERIASLVAHASALLAPSRYESFGLPCLESMACGVPVIASDIPAHREVCRDAAVYADPADPDAWGLQIRTLLADPASRERLSVRGINRSKSFRWSSSVQTLRRVLYASTPVTR